MSLHNCYQLESEEEIEACEKALDDKADTDLDTMFDDAMMCSSVTEAKHLISYWGGSILRYIPRSFMPSSDDVDEILAKKMHI